MAKNDTEKFPKELLASRCRVRTLMIWPRYARVVGYELELGADIDREART